VRLACWNCSLQIFACGVLPTSAHAVDMILFQHTIWLVWVFNFWLWEPRCFGLDTSPLLRMHKWMQCEIHEVRVNYRKSWLVSDQFCCCWLPASLWSAGVCWCVPAALDTATGLFGSCPSFRRAIKIVSTCFWNCYLLPVFSCAHFLQYLYIVLDW
jgi:hypothetical protein